MTDIVDIASMPLFKLVAILPSVFIVVGSIPTKLVIVESTKVISANDDNDNACRFLNVVNAVDSVESTSVSDDTALNSEVDTDATWDPRDDAWVKSAADSVELTAEIDDATVDNDVASDSAPEFLS
jgi:hypothetical protein